MKTYFDGLKEATRRFAWWKDGVQYVGTTGTTLENALVVVAIAERNFYQEQTKLLEERLDKISKVETF